MNPEDGTLHSQHCDNLEAIALFYLDLAVEYFVFFLAGTMSWS
jgi:hypothetical protein